MTIQYNVPIKVLDAHRTPLIQSSLQGYSVFVDRSGNLDGTAFSKEKVPYVGEIVVVKTLKKEAEKTAHRVLKKLEGMVVLPITECSLEEDKERVSRIKQENKLNIPLFE